MMTPESLSITVYMAHLLDELGVPYVVGGSLASTTHGRLRSTLLAKLNWYHMGGELSERQWHDIQGILDIQGEGLDLGYLYEWAERLGLVALWRKAYSEYQYRLLGSE
ncbi:MAG TPA: hypothetical protein VLL52_09270 [Anaerolineae bacterium]|nr:hypothetical protein [Anaerolineae bacterium]